MSLFRRVRNVFRSVARSPLASTALSLFPPTAAVGLSLKAYQSFGQSIPSAPEEILQPTQQQQFFPLLGPIIGGIAAGVGGVAAERVLSGPDEDSDFDDDPEFDDEFDEDEF